MFAVPLPTKRNKKSKEIWHTNIIMNITNTVNVRHVSMHIITMNIITNTEMG